MGTGDREKERKQKKTINDIQRDDDDGNNRPK